MKRVSWIVVVVVWLAAAEAGNAAGPPLATASGVVKKATASVLLVVPRGPDGRFTKTLALKLSGTSKITTLTRQTRGGQTAVVQKDTAPGALQPNQPIAVIYTLIQDEAVLLTAVVQPAPGK
jgi:hypothetical protein